MPIVKSPELLASQLRAREQSALELMAAGVIKIDLTPRQQAAYDDAVNFAAEVDAREREHYASLPSRVAAENAQVLRDLAAGKLYLANEVGGGRVVHFASCPSVRHQVDRDVAHELELVRDPAQVDGSWHSGSGYDTTAKWPNLMTLDEVEQLRVYRACRRCNPDTRERRKVALRQQALSKLTSVGPQRIGRMYETPDGTFLGRLISYTVSAEAVTLHCTEGDYAGGFDATVVLLPIDASGDPNEQSLVAAGPS
jgi:hypothetical protein